MVEMRTDGEVVTLYRGQDQIEVTQPSRSVSVLLDALAEISVGQEDALSSSDPWAEEIFEQIEILQSENHNA